MKRFTYLQGIYSSFYSSDFYRDVKENWGTDVFWYLLLLLSICWAVSTILIQKEINKTYNKFSAMVVPQLPVVIIKNGIVSTPENRPYYIKDENNKDLAIIDTSGQVTTLKDSDAQFLLTSHEYIRKDNKDVITIREILNTFNYELVPTVAEAQLGRIVHYAWVIVFPGCLLTSFLYRIIQALLYAICGKLFSVFSHASLSYFSIFKLSMVAITPSILIVTILNCFNIVFPYMWLLFFVISMGYVVFGIRANTKNIQNR